MTVLILGKGCTSVFTILEGYAFPKFGGGCTSVITIFEGFAYLH